MKRYKYLFVTLLSLSLLILLTPTLSNRRIEHCLDSCPSQCVRRSGWFEVTLWVDNLQGSDHGSAEILILQKGEQIGRLIGYYSYDTLMDIPVGHTRYRWIDADLWPNLVIDTRHPLNSGSAYYLSSRNGQLYAIPPE